MLAEHKNKTLSFVSTDDVEYARRQIRVQVEQRKTDLPANTKVVVLLELNGSLEINLSFDRDSEYGKGQIVRMKELFKVQDRDFRLNSVRTVQTFYMRLNVRLEYPKLGDCSGLKIVDDIDSQIEKLQKSGFVLSKGDKIHHLGHEREAEIKDED